MTKEELAARGLMEVTTHVVVYWDPSSGFTSEIVANEQAAKECRGFGNYAGYSAVPCVVPRVAPLERKWLQDEPMPLDRIGFQEESAEALRAAGITSYCSQVCGGSECGSGPVCLYGIDPNTHMPPQ